VTDGIAVASTALACNASIAAHCKNGANVGKGTALIGKYQRKRKGGRLAAPTPVDRHTEA